MSKTAMQEALEIIQLAREGEIDNDLRSIRHRLEKLLKLEKQQIIDTYNEGYRDAEANGGNVAKGDISEFSNAANYYGYTFEPNI